MKRISQQVSIISKSSLLIQKKLLQLVLMLTLGCLVPIQAKASMFAEAAFYQVDDSPVSITSGDFNRDDKLDLAITSYAAGLEILLGVGDGSFKRGKKFKTNALYSITTGDFNEDGFLDISGVDRGNKFSVLLGVGDGSFANAVSYSVGEGAYPTTNADFNGDGHLDVAVSNGISDNLSVLLGVGDGTFAKAINYPTDEQPDSIVSGDFNNDGDLDLIVAYAAYDSLSILIGIGDGSFAKAVSYPTAAGPTYIISDDFNGDKCLDIAIGNLVGISVFLGNGDGSFVKPVEYSDGKENSEYITSGDFNRDGNLDIVSVNGDGNVKAFLGVGNGTFSIPAKPYITSSLKHAVASFPFGITNGDFNGDGCLDIAVINKVISTTDYLDSVEVILNQSLCSAGRKKSMKVAHID